MLEHERRTYIEKRKTIFNRIRIHRFIYLLLVPAMAYTLVFSYLPMLGIVMAFQDFDIIKGFSGSEFVCLRPRSV